MSDGDKMFEDPTWKVAYDLELTSFTQVNGSFTVNATFALGSFRLIQNGTSRSDSRLNIDMNVKILSTTTFELSLRYFRRYQNVTKANFTFTSDTYSLNQRLKIDFGFSKADQFYWLVNGKLQTLDLIFENGEPFPTGYNTRTLYYEGHGYRPFEHFIGPDDTRNIVGNNRTSEDRNRFKAGANMKVYSIIIQ